MLAKAASGQEPVPMGIFASDQHKPSVHYEGAKWANDAPSYPAPGANQPMAPSGPEVMELEEDPATKPNPLNDRRTLYLDYLFHDTLLMNKMEARWLTPGSCSSVSPSNRGSFC